MCKCHSFRTVLVQKSTNSESGLMIMIRTVPRTILIVISGLAITGCAGHHLGFGGGDRQEPSDLPPQGALLLRYDLNHDGRVTRAEMEQGLRAEFNRLDANHDGCLSKDEVRAENERRWEADASAYSPLQDWKQEGCVDFDTFAAMARSLFDQLDAKGDGILTPKELNPKPKAEPDSRSNTRPSSGSRSGWMCCVRNK